ncbi:hypothetical protein AAFF_G00241380 [Aldrovandia affinis]|uniref:Uncharacterized protein n=1 Tax=Aldrovandia affinis TaxID=143900 RepID=A0AAD7SVV9_9TELE|nr:hypothetical protein AAFF_G00241380 [Aldrovandia affinis]
MRRLHPPFGKKLWRCFNRRAELNSDSIAACMAFQSVCAVAHSSSFLHAGQLFARSPPACPCREPGLGRQRSSAPPRSLRRVPTASPHPLRSVRMQRSS